MSVARSPGDKHREELGSTSGIEGWEAARRHLGHSIHSLPAAAAWLSESIPPPHSFECLWCALRFSFSFTHNRHNHELNLAQNAEGSIRSHHCLSAACRYTNQNAHIFFHKNPYKHGPPSAYALLQRLNHTPSLCLYTTGCTRALGHVRRHGYQV